MMHPVSVSWWSYWGWNPDLGQSLQLPGPERNNPHTLLQAGSGLVMKCCLWNHDKYRIEQKMVCQPGVTKLINLVPNHHTRIIRFHAYHRVNHVIGVELNLEKEIPPHHEGKVEGFGDCAKTPMLYTPPYWLEWLEDSWLSSIRLPNLKQ